MWGESVKALTLIEDDPKWAPRSWVADKIEGGTVKIYFQFSYAVVLIKDVTSLYTIKCIFT